MVVLMHLCACCLSCCRTRLLVLPPLLPGLSPCARPPSPECQEKSCSVWCAAVSNFSSLQYYSQVQATARPVNASDPKLKLWIKTPGNPVISQPPASGFLAEFRDPASAWKQVGWHVHGITPKGVADAGPIGC